MNYIKSFINPESNNIIAETMEETNKNIKTKFKIIETELDNKVNKNVFDNLNNKLLDLQERILYLENQKSTTPSTETVIKPPTDDLIQKSQINQQVNQRFKLLILLNSLITAYLYFKKN